MTLVSGGALVWVAAGPLTPVSVEGPWHGDEGRETRSPFVLKDKGNPHTDVSEGPLFLSHCFKGRVDM